MAIYRWTITAEAECEDQAEADALDQAIFDSLGMEHGMGDVQTQFGEK